MRAARRQMQLDTGFALFLLVLDLADDDAEGGGDGLDDPDRGLSEMLDEEALRYYRTYTAHVEIVNSQATALHLLSPSPSPSPYASPPCKHPETLILRMYQRAGSARKGAVPVPAFLPQADRGVEEGPPRASRPRHARSDRLRLLRADR